MTDGQGSQELDPLTLDELLLSGGFDLRDVPFDASQHASLPRYHALRDPAGAERLGRGLAALLEPLGVDTILIWQEASDVALGFVVARELAIPAVRCFDYDGLVEYDGVFGAGSDAAIVGDTLRDAESVRAMLSLAEQQGKTVTASALLVKTETPGVAELRNHDVVTRFLTTPGSSA